MIKAIILSAGQGQRLKPITQDRPKGMVPVGGRPIIEWQLDLFRRVGLERLAIVQGFCAESIPSYNVLHYSNPDYAVTNMVFSLFCAEPELGEGTVIVSYGDILYSEQVLRQLLSSNGPVSVVVDLDWKTYFGQRFNDAYEDAESLVIDEEGLISSIGQSRPKPEDIHAQYIGLIRFDPDGLAAIRALRDDVSKTDTAIGWGRPWPKAYMTDLLQELARRGVPVRPVPIRGQWCEVDSLRDLELAEQRCKGFLAT